MKQTIDGETIYTIYDLSGRLRHRRNQTTGEWTDYIPLGGRTVARFVNDGTSTTVLYPHSDHLGGAASATDASGNLLWREDYTPFGEPRQNPAGNTDDQAFTGHITDSATGLTYMQARYYDPIIGRFLSQDPVGFQEGGPGYFNRYAYTANDPVNMVDPDGRAAFPLNDAQARLMDQSLKNSSIMGSTRFSGGPVNAAAGVSTYYANVDFSMAFDGSGTDTSLNVAVEMRSGLPTGASISVTSPEHGTGSVQGLAYQMGANVGAQNNDLSGFHSPATNLTGDLKFIGGAITLPSGAHGQGVGGEFGIGIGGGGFLSETRTDPIISLRTPASPGYHEHGALEYAFDDLPNQRTFCPQNIHNYYIFCKHIS